MGAYVYMLSYAAGSYYIDSATGSDLNRRVTEHQSGLRTGYTQLRRPVQLVWSYRCNCSRAQTEKMEPREEASLDRGGLAIFESIVQATGRLAEARSVILRSEREARASKDERPRPSPFEGRAMRGHLRVTDQTVFLELYSAACFAERPCAETR